MELFQTYVPTMLRPEPAPDSDEPDEIMYAIGYEYHPNEFGMAYGPNPDIMEMLEVVPDNPKLMAWLFELHRAENISEKLYFWSGAAWIRITG